MYKRGQEGISYLAGTFIFRKLSVRRHIKAVLEMTTMPKRNKQKSWKPD